MKLLNEPVHLAYDPPYLSFGRPITRDAGSDGRQSVAEAHGRHPSDLAPLQGSGECRGVKAVARKAHEWQRSRIDDPPPGTSNVFPKHIAHPRLVLDQVYIAWFADLREGKEEL